MAEAADGKSGAAGLIGPTSLIIRFTIPRAGRPVNTLVNGLSQHRREPPGLAAVLHRLPHR
jgi:hypothetical protein